MLFRKLLSMLFNFKLFSRLAYKTLFPAPGTNARLTPRRICVILIVLPLYVVIEIFNWLGFLLDEIFFSGYRRHEIRKPVFIIGVPRSGTTFLQRLLARDTAQFTSMRFWEIVFAPSVTQKKIFKAVGAIDKKIGNPLARLIHDFEARRLKKVSNIHKIGFFEAEEDSWTLLHIFSSALLAFMLPFDEDLWPYFCPDLELSAEERARITGFYKRCVQRHLYVFGGGRRFLSKNPLFSAMIGCLNDTFPDAQFICTVRSPFEAVPSVFSLCSFYFHLFLSPVEQIPMREATCRLLSVYYRYPLERLKELPAVRRQIVDYPELTSNPEKTVSALYENFGIPMPPAFRPLLQKETEKARRYKSKHIYSLEQFDLTREDILRDYKDIFDRFGFDQKN